MNGRIAIIGAGIAGIAAARELTRRGFAVTVFEKSRGFGGRCASKRWEGHVVDHGAQYFTIRDARFRDAVRDASGDSIVRIDAPVLDENGAELPDSGRWYHREGNSRLVRDLGRNLEVVKETTVERAETLLRREGGGFDHVVSTAPFPQTARLFGLKATSDYIPCITVLLAYRGEWLGLARERYAVSDRSGPLAWSACENHKTGRVAAGATVIVAQMSERFSRENLERPPDEFPDLVRPLVEDRWKVPAAALAATLGHRWRFARITNPIRPPTFPPGLHFAGDALTASRVEDAWIAGTEVGRTME